jgi:hypothetical protein
MSLHQRPIQMTKSRKGKYFNRMTNINQTRQDKQVSAQSQLQGGLNIHTTIREIKQENKQHEFLI